MAKVESSQEIIPKQDTAESILRLISEKKFPIESFNQQLSKEFKKGDNSNKLYEAIKTSLTPELISTLDSKTVISAQKLLIWIKENLKSTNVDDKLKSIDSLLVYINQRIDQIAVDQKKKKTEIDNNNTSILTSLESSEQPFSLFVGGVSEFSAFLDANPSYLNEANLSKLMNNLGLPSLSPQDRNTYAELILNKVLLSPSLLSQYLGYIKPDSLRYLGSDAETQIKCYNLLVGSPSCKAIATEGSQIQKDLIGLRLAIDNKTNVSFTDQMKDLSNQAKDKVKEFFNDFGAALLSIANLFGGKEGLKKFCKTFNIDLDSNIDTLYKDTYQIDGVKLQSLYDGFSGKTIDDIQSYYSSETRLNAKIISQDPNLNNKTNFESLDPSLIDKANKSLSNIPDLVISDGVSYGEPKYKINTNISLTDIQKSQIVSQIFQDPALWQNINAIQKVAPDDIYGKDNLEKNKLWYTKCPDVKEPKELAVVVGAYLMRGSKDLKQVLNESSLPYEQSHLTKREKQQKEKSDLTSDKTSDTTIETLKNDWTTFFGDIDTTGKWKNYPLTLVAANKLDATNKIKYTEYKNAISAKISTLVDPNTSNFSSLKTDAVLKSKIDPFLTKHFGIYLASLKDNTSIYTDANKKLIEPLIAKFATITTDLSVSLDDAGKLSITGKDSTKPEAKQVKIESSAFSWFPVKKS